MIPTANLVSFMLAAIVIIIIPGPGVLFIIGRSIALGWRAGVLSVLGSSLGMLPAVFAVAFGVGAIVTASVVAFTIIKVAGALYLVYLGVQAIRHRRTRIDAANVPHASTSTLLRQGFVVGLTNPKALAFFVAVLPQFVAPAAGMVWAQLLLLGLIVLFLALISDSAWALAAGTARSWFAKSPRRGATLSTVGGCMMIGLGGALALTGVKS